jgi:hypothetical protein
LVSGGFETHLVAAKLTMQWPDMQIEEQRFFAQFIQCPLKTFTEQTGSNLPTSVTISASPVTTSLEEIGNNVFIHILPNQTAVLAGNSSEKNGVSRRPSMVFCVKPLRWVFRDVVQLVEFMEFHIIVGVTSFHFYGYSYSPQVSLLLFVKNILIKMTMEHLDVAGTRKNP